MNYEERYLILVLFAISPNLRYQNDSFQNIENFQTYKTCIPLSHHRSPDHHLNHFPFQHHQPSLGLPKFNPRIILTGTGSISQVPPLARSSASREPLNSAQPKTKHIFAVLKYQGGSLIGSIEGIIVLEKNHCSNTAGPWIAKNMNEPDNGFVEPI